MGAKEERKDSISRDERATERKRWTRDLKAAGGGNQSGVLLKPV